VGGWWWGGGVFGGVVGAGVVGVGKRVAVIIPDSAERYLSKGIFEGGVSGKLKADRLWLDEIDSDRLHSDEQGLILRSNRGAGAKGKVEVGRIINRKRYEAKRKEHANDH